MELMQNVLGKVMVLFVALLLFGVYGCATMSDKFISGQKANVGFFADHTIAMLSDVNISVGRDETVYARRYFDYDEPEEQKLLFLEDNMQATLEDIVNYSITIVNIMELSFLRCFT